MTASRPRLQCYTLGAILAIAVVAARGAEPPIIAKARAYLGADAALTGVKSIHYAGTLVTTDPKEANKETRAAMEIIFQKPEQQWISITTDKGTETTALDGYEGWMQRKSAANPANTQLTLLGPEQIRRMIANTWENLWFFRGIEKFGGKLEDQGTKVMDGVTCQKIAFIHRPNIVFFRYFDVATGRLVFTETEAGGTIREKGEMIVGGIRFPRSIVTSSGKSATAEDQVVTINFEKITVNETFPAKTFAVPPPPR